MNLSESPVHLGVLGWIWPSWESAFYPPDMPAEWRLTFYNTQFDCVFLAAQRWRQAAPDELQQWITDTHDRFVFLLEQEGKAPVPDAWADKAMLRSREATDVLWFDAETNLKTLAASLRSKAGAPCYLISQDGDLTQLERVRTLLELMGL